MSKKINIKILKFREALGLKPSEFADALGVNRSTMSTYENNGASPGNDFFTKVKTVFPQTCMDYFFSDDAPMFIGEVGDNLPNKIIQESKFIEKDNELVLVGDDSKIVEMQKQTILYLQGTIDKLIAKVEVCSGADLIAA